MERRWFKAPDHPWDWTIPVPFVQAWRVGNVVYVGGQVSADRRGQVIGQGDIEVQTRNVFECIRRILNEAGADMQDLVKLNTYYVFEGSDAELAPFWEKMTRVRMEFLSAPGPVGTAVRVAGLAYPGLLIEADAIAVIPEH
jgi:enamine deaminase RidA (YjgF/YER057c/UK114 family)